MKNKPECTECLLGAPSHEKWHEVPEFTEKEKDEGLRQLKELAEDIAKKRK